MLLSDSLVCLFTGCFFQLMPGTTNLRTGNVAVRSVDHSVSHVLLSLGSLAQGECEIYSSLKGNGISRVGPSAAEVVAFSMHRNHFIILPICVSTPENHIPWSVSPFFQAA